MISAMRYSKWRGGVSIYAIAFDLEVTKLKKNYGDPARGVLVGGGFAQRREVHALAGGDHRGGPTGDLVAVHAVEQDRHRQRRHLLVGHHPVGVGPDHPVDLVVAEPAAVAFGGDDLYGVHVDESRTRSVKGFVVGVEEFVPCTPQNLSQ